MALNFPAEEEKILELWRELDAFAECLRQSAKRPRFTFYDGPPFATGLPHYGHILAGTIKDIVPRWMHQHGYHVERRFGWDTHGLPVEYEIDKNLGITGPDDVARMGIAAYNAECRSIVMRYSSDWEKIVGRLGRWIDFSNDYKTLYPWYMESIWWVFRQLWDKGLIYRGVRVMPYSTGCATPLSNFEASQNYKDVNDPAVVVAFPLDEDPAVSLIAWTTTPWTLPSNLALCVRPEFDYVKVRDKANGDRLLILMEARLEAIFKSEDDYEVVDRFKGSTLKDKTYKPLFDYFGHLKHEGAFRVLCDGYVTKDSGTGVVHQAPYFGEDDNRVCLAAGVIKRGQEIVCPLDQTGRFVEPVTDLKGVYVKDADKVIIKKLKAGGRLVSAGQMKHSYPFCWRSETPLLYRAVPAWFMRVEQMTQRLMAKNDETYWVPEAIREGRFANWLRDARDWNLSRNRYWGTPMPVWTSEDGLECVCVGSIDELEALSGVRVDDLHRETVDAITIPSKRPGVAPLKRITEVFDCWFESGSMPYAQSHYPFENKKAFEDAFPADFIAEGTDQTRGWFYTLLVLSTALFDRPPFKNLIVNGLVLATDGQKMSKSKKNYPDPTLVINKYGADALRLYLINSPVVKAETLRFKEEGVKDILKDVLLPWYNAYRFLLQNAGEGYAWREVPDAYGKSANVMDRWITSFAQSLLAFVGREMAAYRLYTVVPRLVKFIDNLTNWYVRTNRKRLRARDPGALGTLFAVVFTMVRVNAPFTPFIAEHMYQGMKGFVEWPADAGNVDSVHYLMIPSPRLDLVDDNIERAVGRMQTVVELGRVVRDRKTMPVKYPLPELVVIHKDRECLDDVASLKEYILEELNVKKLTLSTDKEQYGVSFRAEPDHKTLGARLKGAFKEVTKEIKALSDVQVAQFIKDDKIVVAGHTLGPDDIRIMYSFDNAAHARYEVHSEADILILLDCTPDQSMLDEGVAREVINRVQRLRKKANLSPSDDVHVHYSIEPAGHDLARVIDVHRGYIESTTKNPMLESKEFSTAGSMIAEDYDLKGAKMRLAVRRPGLGGRRPAVPYVNVSCGHKKGVVLLENPAGSNSVFDEASGLASCIQQLMGVGCVDVSGLNVATLDGKTITISSSGCAMLDASESDVFCPFVNVKTCDGRLSTLLLENPASVDVTAHVEDALFTALGVTMPNVDWRGSVGRTLEASS